MRKRTNRVLLAVWFAGMMCWSLPLFAANGSPINSEFQIYALWALVGAAFTVLFWIARRWVNQVSKLTEALQKLTLETKLDRQANKQHSKDINIINRRINKVQDWINKHVLFHVTCPECPATDETL